MWYLSLALSYRLELGDNRKIRLKSLRRTLRISAMEISVVEFPRVGFGFIPFRLEREKAYLFCLPKNAVLKAVLEEIKSANPDITFKQR